MTNVLPGLLQDYTGNNIYKDRKNKSISSSKVAKDKVRALVICIMSGTDKQILFIIRKRKQPKCFKGKTLPVTFEANKNAWITYKIFKLWIWDVNKHMKSQRCNCAVHSATATNIKLVFLPPNTTSLIQPCNHDIIWNLKTHYRKQVMQKNISDTHSNDKLTANILVNHSHINSEETNSAEPTSNIMLPLSMNASWNVTSTISWSGTVCPATTTYVLHLILINNDTDPIAMMNSFSLWSVVKYENLRTVNIPLKRMDILT